MSDLTGKERAAKWPSVFTVKTLQATYIQKGRAAKTYDLVTKKWRYTVCFGNVQLHGSEGELRGLSPKIPRQASHSRHTLGIGEVCEDPNDDGTAPEGAIVDESRKRARQSTKEEGGQASLSSAPVTGQTSTSTTPSAPVAKQLSSSAALSAPVAVAEQASSSITSNTPVAEQASASTTPSAPATKQVSATIEGDPNIAELSSMKEGPQSIATTSNEESSQEIDMMPTKESSPRDSTGTPVRERKRGPRRLAAEKILKLEKEDDRVKKLERQLRKALERNDEADNLERDLKEAEDKLALLSVTAGTVYQTARWVNDFLRRTVKQLNFLVKRVEGSLPSSASRIVTLEDMRTEEAQSCIKEYKNAVHDRLESFNGSIDTFYDTYPELSEEIFGLEVDSHRQSIVLQDEGQGAAKIGADQEVAGQYAS